MQGKENFHSPSGAASAVSEFRHFWAVCLPSSMHTLKDRLAKFDAPTGAATAAIVSVWYSRTLS